MAARGADEAYVTVGGKEGIKQPQAGTYLNAQYRKRGVQENKEIVRENGQNFGNTRGAKRFGRKRKGEA